MLPVAIGIAVSIYLVVVVSRIDTSRLAQIPFSRHLVYGLLLAILTVTVRDLAYIYRMWKLTDHRLSFFKCFEIIMLWEFGSSVTPASVGGFTAMYFISKEKISFGKSASIVMLCSYMDNVAFGTVFTLMFLIVGPSMFDLSAVCTDLGNGNIFAAVRTMAGYAWLGFVAVVVVGGLLGFGIFVRPGWARTFFSRLSGIKWLHRWREPISLLGEEIWLTSHEFKSKGLGFLLKVFIATSISWCARYALGSVLIWTFATIHLHQLEVFARQCVLRVLIFIPATPGGSGVSELAFMALNCDYLPAGLSSAVVIIFIWA
ncbi:unnamed protein product [Sphagnum jensenii]